MSEERKKQLIDKARELFAKAGFEKMRVKDLAQKCGITEPAVYRYFASKEKIYDAVLESIKERASVENLLKSLDDEEDMEKIMFAIAKNILSLYSSDRYATRLLLYSSLEGHNQAKKVFTAIRIPYIEFLSERISDLMERGLVKEVQPLITARCFVGMVFDCSMNYNIWKGMSGKVFNPEETIMNNIPIYARGLKNS